MSVSTSLVKRSSIQSAMDCTQPKTNSSPLQMVVKPNPESPNFQGAPIFRGELLVSGIVTNHPENDKNNN